MKQTSSAAVDLCPRQSKEVVFRQKEISSYIKDKLKGALHYAWLPKGNSLSSCQTYKRYVGNKREVS